MYNAVNENKF